MKSHYQGYIPVDLLPMTQCSLSLLSQTFGQVTADLGISAFSSRTRGRRIIQVERNIQDMDMPEREGNIRRGRTSYSMSSPGEVNIRDL